MHKARVFLSYSHDDVDPQWLRSFVDALRSNDLKVWWDEESIRAGESIPASMAAALHESDSMVVLLSESYLQSPWGAFEMGVALGQDKRLIPIAPDSIEPARWPGPLRVRRAVRLRAPDETAREVAQALAASSNVMEAG